jgi:hypothetical protein
LVDPVDGGPPGIEPIDGVSGLARLWVGPAQTGFVEVVQGSGTHTSVRQLNTDIRAWIDTWNDNPRPYVWTKTADQILASIANYCTQINDSGH